jgi:hypothetical protein
MSRIHYPINFLFFKESSYLSDPLNCLSNELRLHPLERRMSISGEVCLSGVCGWAAIVHIHTLVLEGACCVEQVWCLWRWHRLRMVEESFGCRQVRIALSAYSR